MGLIAVVEWLPALLVTHANEGPVPVFVVSSTVPWHRHCLRRKARPPCLRIENGDVPYSLSATGDETSEVIFVGGPKSTG